MKLLKINKWIVLSLFTLINGCASTGDNSKVSFPKYYGKTPVYGSLTQLSSGKYVITTLGTDLNKGNVFRLNDLHPMWNTRTEKKCMMGSGLLRKSSDYNYYHCRTYDPKKFRFDSIDTSQILSTAILTTVTVGISGTLRQTNVVFDETAYISAVSEALKNSSINRTNIINTVDSIKKNQDEKLAKYNKFVSTFPIKPKVNDKSGLYTENDNYFNQYINIIKRKNDLSFTVDSKDENKIHDILIEKTNNDFNKQLETLSIKCSGYDNTYDFEIDCSNSIDVTNGITNISPIVTVKSKNIDKLLPNYFEGEDENLKVSIQGKNILVENRSNNFISVQSASVYYKYKINTRAIELEMPPKSNHSLSLNDFLYNLPSIQRRSYTLEKAKNELVDFGFAIKYEIANQKKSQTLFKHKEFSGKDLL